MMNSENKTKKVPEEMPLTSHPGGHKNDADPQEEKDKPINKDISLQSQKGKKVDADPTDPDGRPTTTG